LKKEEEMSDYIKIKIVCNLEKGTRRLLKQHIIITQMTTCFYLICLYTAMNNLLSFSDI